MNAKGQCRSWLRNDSRHLRNSGRAKDQSSRCLIHSWSVWYLTAGLYPKFSRDVDGIDAHVVPPGGFVAAMVKLAMMDAAERHGEFVTDFAPHGARLGEADMVRIGGRGAAEQAWL